MRILCTADIHIGRRSTKIPSDLEGKQFSAANMWNFIVDRAIKNKVDVLLLAGDIVDHENRYYEAFGPLESGLKLLAENNIHTVAIAGNHDYDVLFRLESYVGTEFYHLLGKGGEWEQHSISNNEKGPLNIIGWSFPSEHVKINPLLSLESDAINPVPTIGLLHADVDQVQSNYAPVQRRELMQVPVVLWVVGHTHIPNLLQEAGLPSILIPGSPQALDPGEIGTHGPWLLELCNQKIVKIEKVPLSNVRYQNLTIDLTDVVNREDWDWKCTESIRNFIEQHHTEFGPLELLLFRIQLTGRTQLYAQLFELSQRMQEDLSLEHSGIPVRIEKIENQTRPTLNLDELSRSNDPPGILARMIIDLESTNPTQFVNLIHNAHERIEQVFRNNAFSDIAMQEDYPSKSLARQMLINEGYLLLESLLAQREDNL